MHRVSVPWGLWYGKTPFEMTFPDEWKVTRCAMRDGPDISDTQIEEAFLHPIGTQPLSELAKGRKNAAIAVDDMTRPTQAYRILPILLRHLEKAGLSRKDVTIVIALGAHRSMDKKDMVKKLGEEIVQTMSIYNHHPYEHLSPCGQVRPRDRHLCQSFFCRCRSEDRTQLHYPAPHGGIRGRRQDHPPRPGRY